MILAKASFSGTAKIGKEIGFVLKIGEVIPRDSHLGIQEVEKEDFQHPKLSNLP